MILTILRKSLFLKMSNPPSVVRQFEVEKLNVPGAEIIKSPVYGDLRGSLYESFHILKLRTTCSVSQILGIYPARKVVYGPVSHDGEEYMYLIRGKLFVALVDKEHPETKDILEVVPGMIVRIPSDCVHAFLSLEDDTIFDIVRTTGILHEEQYELNDAKFNIPWPASEQPLVQKPKNDHQSEKPRPQYAVMGATGMIGSAFVREIEARGCSWYQIRSRLHQHEAIRNELMEVRPTVGVIIAAGVGTRPNTKWCEDHRLETFDANVTCQLAIAGICEKLGLHCTLIGTSGFYHYDENHPLSDLTKGFSEDDIPNHECNYYYQMRVYLEKLLNETGAIKNVLNLRALFPFDHKVTSSSLIGKLLRFNKINCIKTSMTVLNDLVPLALDMINDKEVGHVNWVCQGTYSNGDLLQAYKRVVDPSIEINEVEVTQQQSKEMGNSAAYVIPARLIKKFGAEKVPKLEDSVQRLMEKIKAEKQ
ncbi:dTDP-D-glucose 4,6-dehydratase [Tritrichomonas foetus]|uniref:dTDP-D-glucose 4,6-dehydratase n=1 Tax=Tritrichomonas foetus TaxID=1144522 RepID=A0A1J4JSU5_9EUKA|nr:dTDP-D-glucose 4,6-dehydratase [Tritrichomonas foetus]|eukprot:OHT02199.1 dTDP-D-glucose 4,6-dehydratase [Tritrichomonas foetus]